ncbi:BON domain-containing protein [Paraburkholderia sp. A3RO-2L]|uniref:BON domain-containing protein n=1 Tax=Paraburkholderia sp. A3RO-2L TaxID=3028376 RepID=UPI003DA928DE
MRVEVEHRCVTLIGEADLCYQHNAAESVVSRMRGLVGVANRLSVRHSDAALHGAQHISAALARPAQREFAGIHIDEHDGVMTLIDTVASLHERLAACGAVWFTRGVRAVVDRPVV